MLNVEREHWNSLVCLEEGLTLYENNDVSYALLSNDKIIDV